MEDEDDIIGDVVASESDIFDAKENPLTRSEQKVLNRARSEYIAEKIARFKSDTRDRKWLAEWTSIVVTLWLMMVVVILINQDKFPLSDTVLVTLLGTTTLNVLGLPLIVLRGHFLKGKE